MHIFFSGIGGSGIGPLSLIAKQAGYLVSGSDKQDSEYIHYLNKLGIDHISIGQSKQNIKKVHEYSPIDWFVYSSAVFKENPSSEEMTFCKKNKIKISKRDELLNEILLQKKLKLIAVAGTHGKTTTTAMLIWLFKNLDLNLSYSVGAKLSYGEMGEYNSNSSYFVYECDEFDRNFLAFKPWLSLITGIGWDHHDIFPTKDLYNQAFKEFIGQSKRSVIWQKDLEYLGLSNSENLQILSSNHELEKQIKLAGEVNRQDAILALSAFSEITQLPKSLLIDIINNFPGISRRFEKLAENLYTDYAHTAEKIAGLLQLVSENSKNIVVVYEGLHNRRQHFMLEQNQFKDLFKGVAKLYWVPSYLAREDPTQELLSAKYLIEKTGLRILAEPAELNDELFNKIETHRRKGDLVLCISAGGGGSLDEWVRAHCK